MLVPLNVPPSVPPCIALLFLCIYLPVLALTILQCGEPEGVMKNTPRKNNFHLQRRPKDTQRFYVYLAIRSSFVAISVAIVGWFCTASTMRFTFNTPISLIERLEDSSPLCIVMFDYMMFI